VVDHATTSTSVGGCMRRVIMLGFCCTCTRCVWATVNNNGAYLYVDEKDIHVDGEPDPRMTIVCAEVGVIVLREREVTLPGSDERALRYTNHEWGIATEGLSGPCAQCEAGFSQSKGESWADLPQAEKNRRRLASVSTKRKKGSNGRDQEVRTSPKDDHQIVRLDDYRKGTLTPDRPVPVDQKRKDGHRGKSKDIRRQAKRARAYGG